MDEVMVINHQRQIADVTRDIRVKTGQFLLDAIEIGRLLYEAKSMVEPGGWMQYVEDELPFSQSWANNYMRLYKEYGSEQLSVFENSQATAKLSPTQALELLALPAQEREEFMQTHDVENMSTRELHQAIKERDDAIRAQEAEEAARVEAENAASEAERKLGVARERADRLQSNLETAQAAQAAASAEVEKLKEQVKKAKEKEKAAKDALEKAKENPEIPEAMMEQMRQQVAADAAQKATEELQKKLDAAMSAEAKAVAAHQEAEQKLAAAQKAMKLSNPEIAKLQLLTDQWVGSSNGLRDQLLKAKQADPETAGKVQTAILAAIEQVKAMIAGI